MKILSIICLTFLLITLAIACLYEKNESTRKFEILIFILIAIPDIYLLMN